MSFFMQSNWCNDTVYLWEHRVTVERTQGAFSECVVSLRPCVIPLITNVQSNNVDMTGDRNLRHCSSWCWFHCVVCEAIFVG